MSERKPGWYWVREFENTPWKCQQWSGEWWHGRGMYHEFPIIGPRIPAPGEGWRCVPVEPTIEMLAALGWGGDVSLAIGHGAITEELEEGYAAMLAAAPKP